MKVNIKYRLIPAACFIALVITSCGSYERITDSKEVTGNYAQEESGRKEISSAPETEETTKESTSETEMQGKEDAAGAEQIPGANLSAQAAALCGQYFKAGDFASRLFVSPGEPDSRGILQVHFSKRDKAFSNAFTKIHELSLPYKDGTSSYSLEDTAYGSSGAAFTVVLNKDGSITLQGSTEAAGDYYAMEDSLVMSDAFSRPLNDTDLIGLNLDDMQLLRNQFYAVYGRIFKNEKLKSYFETEPWYKGNIDGDQFSEELLSGIEKRNIAFLKAAEEKYDERQALEQKTAYDALPAAPYLELLPKKGEIYFNIYSDFEHAADRGIYYEAEGTIYVPITVTREQLKTVDAGDSVELVTDELTGKTSVLKKSQNPDYGMYVLTDKNDSGKESGDYVMASYEADIGTYRLWGDSDDTRFKRVYEGSIYVLKGACEEYFGYFDLPVKDREEMAGSYRVMDFNEVTPYGPSPYEGNEPVTDPKGYIKALYFHGD